MSLPPKNVSVIRAAPLMPAGVDPQLAALTLAYNTNLFGSINQYASAQVRVGWRQSSNKSPAVHAVLLANSPFPAFLPRGLQLTAPYPPLSLRARAGCCILWRRVLCSVEAVGHRRGGWHFDAGDTPDSWHGLVESSGHLAQVNSKKPQWGVITVVTRNVLLAAWGIKTQHIKTHSSHGTLPHHP